MSNYFDHLLSLNTPTYTVAQIAGRFKPNTVLRAFCTREHSSCNLSTFCGISDILPVAQAYTPERLWPCLNHWFNPRFDKLFGNLVKGRCDLEWGRHPGCI